MDEEASWEVWDWDEEDQLLYQGADLIMRGNTALAAYAVGNKRKHGGSAPGRRANLDRNIEAGGRQLNIMITVLWRQPCTVYPEDVFRRRFRIHWHRFE